MCENQSKVNTLAEYVESIRSESIAVVGAGVSNLPLIELLLKNGCDVTVCDLRSPEKMGEDYTRLQAMGAKFRLGEDYLEGLTESLIFRTPGLMPFDPHLEAAMAGGSRVTSEMEVFFRLCPCRILSVTGSDGKTTTTTIISELLKAAGYTVHLGGNIGHPLLCDLPIMKAEDMVVLELSSFQLHSMSCRPDVAVITNISPNHLDKHKDYADYYDAKMSIFLEQGPEQRLVLNAADGKTPYFKEHAKSRLAYFLDGAPVEAGVYCENGTVYRVTEQGPQAILQEDEIRLPGRHNIQNYMAAFAATDGLVSDEVCRRVAAEFAGVEHRLETVRVRRGVRYINDSIASSPTRTAAGLHALKTKPILILGGYDKHIPFDELGDEVCCYAKSAFVTGATAQPIAQAIRGSKYFADSGLQLTVLEDFDETVHAAADSAVEGDIVLLSPACASFDRFPNFAVRGRHFKKLIMELED